MQAELGPGQNLAKLFERAEAARQRDKGVGELRHESLALVHGADDSQIG